MRPLAALRQGATGLRRQPALLLGFSSLACGVHLIGWGLFAAGHAVDSGVLAAVLHVSGTTLYAGSLLWWIEGLSRAGLALATGSAIGWRTLRRWRTGASGRLALALLSLLALLLLEALLGFMAWSLALFLLPGLAAVTALLTLLLLAATSLSQLFLCCEVLAQGLGPAEALRAGVLLLEQHGPRLLALGGLLLGLLLSPVLLGLVVEGLANRLGASATVAGLVAVAPLLATTTTAAYAQLRPAPPLSSAAH